MANIKFYMTPGTCSTGIHILLEELGLIFEAYVVNLPAGDQFKPDYLAINPKSTIPTLITPEGKTITDFCAIAWWLARSYPKAKLLPAGLMQETRVLENLNYIVNTIHMQGYTRIFTSANYSFDTADTERIKAQGEIIVKQGLALLDRQLAGQEYLGASFSIADAALFYVEFWADRIGITLSQYCRRHYQRLLSRPAVQQVLREEGYGMLLSQTAPRAMI